jgi:hypothetical protein
MGRCEFPGCENPETGSINGHFFCNNPDHIKAVVANSFKPPTTALESLESLDEE